LAKCTLRKLNPKEVTQQVKNRKQHSDKKPATQAPELGHVKYHREAIGWVTKESHRNGGGAWTEDRV